jgi:hypothetical protein
MAHRGMAAFASLLMITSFALAACTNEPAAAPTETETPVAAPSPTPTPTPEALVVAPGARPPAPAGGDCAQLITAEQLTGILGVPVSAVQARDPRWEVLLANVGGLTCEWEADGGSYGYVQVIPAAQLAGVTLSEAERAYYFETCIYVCSWEDPRAGYWIGGAIDANLLSRAETGAVAPRIADVVAANLARIDEPWTRDRTGWWPPLDCAALATALGDRLGSSLSGEATGSQDAASIGIHLADLSVGGTMCRVTAGGEDQLIEITFSPGMAWYLPPESEATATPIDLGVPSVSVFALTGNGLAGGVMSDGVNRLLAPVPDTLAIGPDRFLSALAQLVADGFPTAR